MFFKRGNYKKIGLIFCLGLWKEANELTRVYQHHGFEVCSVACKNGTVPKASFDEDEPGECGVGIACNPIGQALIANAYDVDFNVLLGLCVGHDTLALKYLEAPTTVLAVKDRVTGHAPLAPLYSAKTYYKKKLYSE